MTLSMSPLKTQSVTNRGEAILGRTSGVVAGMRNPACHAARETPSLAMGAVASGAISRIPGKVRTISEMLPGVVDAVGRAEGGEGPAVVLEAGQEVVDAVVRVNGMQFLRFIGELLD